MSKTEHLEWYPGFNKETGYQVNSSCLTIFYLRALRGSNSHHEVHEEHEESEDHMDAGFDLQLLLEPTV